MFTCVTNDYSQTALTAVLHSHTDRTQSVSIGLLFRFMALVPSRSSFNLIHSDLIVFVFVLYLLLVNKICCCLLFLLLLTHVKRMPIQYIRT